MDNFIVSARKYRPVTFDSVVGQQHITGTLKNAIKNNQLAQAFLFCGPRGVGKTTCARILAKTINCEHLSDTVEACGTCDSCKSFQSGSSFTIHELDAASNNSVDDIRSITDQVRIPPQTGKYKIYIIDEVHMLSSSAFNAFLKTLEEPPPYAIFILATTEKHKILPTILSRCQIFDFNRIQVADMAAHLASIADKEGVRYDADGLHIIAQKADGGLRDALSMFDQIVSFSNKNVSYQAVIDNLNILDYDYYFKIVDAIIGENSSSALLTTDEIIGNGFDGSHFISGLAGHLRNLLVAREPATVKLLEVSDSIRKRYLKQAAEVNSGTLLSALNIANQCEINYRTSKNQRLQVELAILKMCHIAAAIRLADLGEIALPQGTAEKKKPSENVVSGANPTAQAAPTPVAVVKEVPAIPIPEKPAALAPDEPAEKPIPKDKDTLAQPEGQPKPAKASWSNIKLGESIPDLNKILDQQKKDDKNDEPTLVEGEDVQAFGDDELLREWHNFADRLKKENKINLFTLMTANAPKLLPEYKIEVLVENQIQRELLEISKIDIVNVLRPALRNYQIDIVISQLANDVVRKPYTSQEKYKAMVAKNPALDKLRQEFNLGLE